MKKTKREKRKELRARRAAEIEREAMAWLHAWPPYGKGLW